MALSKTTETAFGIQVVDAYYRIESVTLSPKETMTFRVRAYADPTFAHFSDGLFECAYEVNDVNPFKQAYLYLKTLPEFEGAEDV